MSESANLMPFVCKWLGTHSDPQHFETEEKLRDHIIQHDINSCKILNPDGPFYKCPWKGCHKHQSSSNELKEHLRQHTQQKPFKCPICNCLRFGSPDALSQHLIMNHNDSVVDSDTDDENERLNLGKVEDKNDLRVKKVSKDEKKLSYRDVLVGRVNENKIAENEHEKAVDLSYQDVENKNAENHERIWDLLNKGFEIVSLLPESPFSEYDYENENYDDFPDAPREILTEIESEKLMLRSVCNLYKDTEASEYFNKAFEMMDSGNS